MLKILPSLLLMFFSAMANSQNTLEKVLSEAFYNAPLDKSEEIIKGFFNSDSRFAVFEKNVAEHSDLEGNAKKTMFWNMSSTDSSFDIASTHAEIFLAITSINGGKEKFSNLSVYYYFQKNSDADKLLDKICGLVEEKNEKLFKQKDTELNSTTAIFNTDIGGIRYQILLTQGVFMGERNAGKPYVSISIKK